MVDDPRRRRVFIIGIGMTKFVKPGSRDWDYPDMVQEAVGKALKDSGLKYGDMEQAAVGYIFGATCSGQRALYPLGMTGIPIYNVNNACASGSSAILQMKHIIEAGRADCVLAVGFEKMASGSLENMGGQFNDRVNPVDRHVEVMSETFGMEPAPLMAQFFGNAGREHMEKFGTKPVHFAKIAWKNHKHSVHNPDAQFRKEYSLEQIMNSRMIHEPLTLLQCSPTSDGAAAAVLCSEEFLRKHPHLKPRAVEIVGMTLATDLPSAFEEKSNMKMVGYDACKLAAAKLFKETGLGPKDVQVIELHDCFSTNELLSYEALGLCPQGQAKDLIDRGDNTYGGKWVINPSGGLISKGHPIGATGVAQCVELCEHLRGEAGQRQVPRARIGLQHNIGIGGAVVLGLYRLAYPKFPDSPLQTASSASIDGGSSFNSDVVFQAVKERAQKEGASLVKRVGASFEFVVTTGVPGSVAKRWKLDFTKSPPFVGLGHQSDKVDCEFIISDKDLMAVVQGKAKIEQMFLQGKMTVKGNAAKAMKLKEILGQEDLHAKL